MIAYVFHCPAKYGIIHKLETIFSKLLAAFVRS